MDRCLQIFILAFPTLSYQNCLDFYYITQIINITHRYYHSGCVILLKENDYDQSEELFLFLILKRLQLFLVPSSVAILQVAFQSLSAPLCFPVTPLFVLLSSSGKLQQYLEMWSVNTSLSSAAWLMFPSESFDIETYFSHIVIPFNCKFLVAIKVSEHYKLTEIYRTTPNSETKSSVYGEYIPNMTSYNQQYIQYGRKFQLDGETILGSTLQPLLFPKNPKKRLRETLNRMFEMLYASLRQSMNLTIRWILPWNNTYGICSNSSCNGIVEMIRTGNIEVGFDSYLMDNVRYDVVDFSTPLLNVKNKIYIKMPTEDGTKWEIYICTLSWRVWCCVLAILFLMTILHFKSLRKSSNEMSHPKHSVFHLYDSIFLIISIFFLKGENHFYRSISTSLLFFIANFFAVVIMVAYCATLISSLTTRTVKLPFQDFNGLLKDKDYDFIAINVQTGYHYFENSKQNAFREVFDKYLFPNKDYLPNSTEEGILRTCAQENLALFTSLELFTDLLEKIHCELIGLDGDSVIHPVSLIFPKMSWYKKAFNVHLQKLMGNGVIHKIKEMFRKPVMPTSSEFFPVDLSDILPLLTIFICECMVAAFIFVVENIVKTT